MTEIRTEAANWAEGQNLRGLGWKGPRGSSHSLQGPAEPHRAGRCPPLPAHSVLAAPGEGVKSIKLILIAIQGQKIHLNISNQQASNEAC